MNDDEKVYLYDRSEMLKRQRDTAEEERDAWKLRAMRVEQERQAARVEADHWKAEWALAVNKATHVHYEALHTTNTNLRDQLILAEGQRDQAKASVEDIVNNWQRTYDHDCKKLIQRAEAAEAERHVWEQRARMVVRERRALRVERDTMKQRAEAAEASLAVAWASMEKMQSVIDMLIAERDALRVECEAVRVLLKRVPSALNSAFWAGAEECENGSARRQEKYMEPVYALRKDITAALAVQP